MSLKHKCIYCGNENDGCYKGSCPQCPPYAMNNYHRKSKMNKMRKETIDTGLGLISEQSVHLKDYMSDAFIIMVTSLLKVMYIANASDCDVSESWQKNSDASEHYTPVSKVLVDLVGPDCYNHYIETGDFDWAKLYGRHTR